MTEGGAGKKTEKPERTRRVGGGTAEGKQVVHQAGTACDDHVGDHKSLTMEEVICRENMLAAYRRVVGNKGAAGVDGMTVDELMEHIPGPDFPTGAIINGRASIIQAYRSGRGRIYVRARAEVVTDEKKGKDREKRTEGRAEAKAEKLSL